jgi:glyoxylase-like metal-dependent hydrolase (beta-lactamase superfamily II)
MNDIVESLSDEYNIHFVIGQRNGGYPYSHSMLIEDYLIDTGISRRHMRKLKKDYHINNVILSHWHEDHISSNSLLKNATYFCHSKDIHIVEDISKIGPYYGLSKEFTDNILGAFLDGFKMENTKVDKSLEHNDLLTINDCRLRVIHTPGHTAGHCSFYEENTKIAFFADIDLTSFGPFYGGIDSSLIDFEESIEKLKNLDIEIAVTSHKGLFEGKELIREELDKYKSKLIKYEENIMSHLSEKTPITSKDLINKNLIYRKYSAAKEFELIAERIMIEKHFDKFLKNNTVEKLNNGYVLK